MVHRRHVFFNAIGRFFQFCSMARRKTEGLTPARRRNVREVTSGCRTGRPYIPLYAAMESMLTIGFSIKQI